MRCWGGAGVGGRNGMGRRGVERGERMKGRRGVVVGRGKERGGTGRKDGKKI